MFNIVCYFDPCHCRGEILSEFTRPGQNENQRLCPRGDCCRSDWPYRFFSLVSVSEKFIEHLIRHWSEPSIGKQTSRNCFDRSIEWTNQTEGSFHEAIVDLLVGRRSSHISFWLRLGGRLAWLQPGSDTGAAFLIRPGALAECGMRKVEGV